MPAYNFKSRFAPKVESGEKRQTIRKRRKVGNAVPEKPIQLYVGQRTKACRKLVDPDPECKSVHPIKITRHFAFGAVFVDGKKLTYLETFNLTRDDGFSSTVDFFHFFVPDPGDVFDDAVLIKW